MGKKSPTKENKVENKKVNKLSTSDTLKWSICFGVVGILLGLLVQFRPFWSSTLEKRYESSIIDYETQKKLSTNGKCTLDFNRRNKVMNVTDVMEEGYEKRVKDKTLFVMLNGKNEGVHVNWNGREECLYAAARFGGEYVGADLDWIENGIRLYSQNGYALENGGMVEKEGRIVHVLMVDQVWVWPGIRIGHVYHLENGVKMTTIALMPTVYDVEHFFTDEEAGKIIEYGMKKLNRSRIEGKNHTYAVSESRTSHTAFLPDSVFTREFQSRSTKLARLSSASFAERLQLVRYAKGEFYRRHLDTFHSKQFVPEAAYAYTYEDYRMWCDWASAKIIELKDTIDIPHEFLPGNAYHPVASDNTTFQHTVLTDFLDFANRTNYHIAHDTTHWDQFWKDHIKNGTANLIQGVVDPKKGKNIVLKHIVQVWENRIGIPQLKYTFPKKPTNGVTHYLRWIRWAKERIAHLGPNNLPSLIRPNGAYYPKFTLSFQNLVVNWLLDDYSPAFFIKLTNKAWYDWLALNKDRKDVFIKAANAYPSLVELAVRTWEQRSGTTKMRYSFPKYIKHFEPQRFVTLFLYLTDVQEGGETVFPYSPSTLVTGINRTGMSECSRGLAVPARGLHASMFYVQNAENDVDRWSRHGGCPPEEGIKWGSNSFMWNVDAEEGSAAWR